MRWGKDYVFSLSDPFEFKECPGRSLGVRTNKGLRALQYVEFLFTFTLKVVLKAVIL